MPHRWGAENGQGWEGRVVLRCDLGPLEVRRAFLEKGNWARRHFEQNDWIKAMHYTTLTLTMAFCVWFGCVRPASGQTADASPPNVVSSSAGDIRVERLATLEFPWGMALLPDGGMLITEKPGRLRIWADGQLSEPVEGVPESVYRDSKSEQGGLMDVAVDPDFANNSLVYLSFSEAA